MSKEGSAKKVSTQVQIFLNQYRQGFIIKFSNILEQAMIRLTCSDRKSKPTFDFGKNFRDRDAIRDGLNKLQARSLQPEPEKAGPAAVPEPITPQSAEELARIKILLGKKEVRRLHTQLVRSGAVSRDKFWSAMKYRYKPNGERRIVRGVAALDSEDEALEKGTEEGVPSDAYELGKANLDKWKDGIPDAGQRHLVFMEEKAVMRAYEAKVGELGEKRFWEIYRQSSYGGRRGVGGKMQSVKTGAADGVFAPFEASMRELERKEKEKRIGELARGLDLDHFDDHRGAHVARSEGKGKKRGLEGEGLSLMRRVNRHGSLIVKGKGWEEENGVKGRPLEDLDGNEKEKFAKVGVELEGKRARREDTDVMMVRWSGLTEMWTLDVSRFDQTVYGSGHVLSDLVSRMKP